MRIALVNCAVLPEPDPDEAPLLAALRAVGHDARTLAWDDPEADPGAFDACVLRATWNYHRRPDDFRAWLGRAAERTRLINPPGTVLWNMHKGYLRELESRRIPIVPTAWADRGSATDLGECCAARRWAKIVIKPAVSGGSRETRVFDIPSETAEGQSFLDASVAREDTMIQRYLPAVERGGEIAVVCLGGAVSHAVRKRPRFAGQAESVEAYAPIGEAERRFAQAVLEVCPVPAAYARVDIMLGDAGEIMLSELELIEPSLFFGFGPGSADRFARIIESALSPAGASS
ncbi:MAG: hypothetical protein LAT64_09665 [Phycisphaerales bacterium]|nr:hypothetical protein [Planctomycetota bacterium]MCH8509015.1 hypothetical protein [Phycisphaerales bacterium]